MANRERGEVLLSVGDREYRLVCTTNAQCEMEARLSTPEREVTSGDIYRGVTKTSNTAVRAFLWACLLRHHRAEFPTIESVGDRVIDVIGLKAATVAASEAFERSQPDADDVAALGKPKDPRRAAGGTGPRSTAPLDGRASTATASGS